MFTASIGPYLYEIAGLDPSTWSVPSFLRRRDQGKGAEDDEITMHVTPDPYAVRVLGQASGTVATMCGQLAVEWRTVPVSQPPRPCPVTHLLHPLHSIASASVCDLCMRSITIFGTGRAL